MGMDVYGQKPLTEKGEYFRNNVWSWRPLWDYCTHIDPTLILSVPNAHNNSGDGLPGPLARKLGFKLQTEIQSGQTQKYIETYYEETQKLPKQNCQYCDENGQRTWQKLNGEPYTKNCNVCDATKKIDHPQTHYHIDLDNIKEFSEFLINCGGFKIC